MSFADALIYSAIGLGVVFFALILLMCIIKIMTAIGDRAQKRSAQQAPSTLPDIEAPLQTLSVTGPTAPGSAGDLKLYDTDPRTAAMLMAIVADELKLPLNELRFISIKEIKEND